MAMSRIGGKAPLVGEMPRWLGDGKVTEKIRNGEHVSCNALNQKRKIKKKWIVLLLARPVLTRKKQKMIIHVIILVTRSWNLGKFMGKLFEAGNSEKK
ncbi:MAG: hypothetical protein ACOY4H_14350 [Thermodesulfobacteriota bacterium]